MIVIDFPHPSFKVRKEKDKHFIFDTIRKKWLLLTPEEWVRQNFIQYLVQVKGYPASLIAVEKEIMLGELKKRFDLLVYDKDHKPWMIIECKEMNVPMSEDVLQQVLRYNISVPVEFVVITNGKLTFGWKRSEKGFELIDEIPGN